MALLKPLALRPYRSLTVFAPTLNPKLPPLSSVERGRWG